MKARGSIGLHDQHALQQAAIDDRHAEKRAVRILARLAEVFEPRVRRRIRDDLRPQLLGDETGQALGQPHADPADALGAEADRCREHEVGAVGLEQVDRTDVGAISVAAAGLPAERFWRLVGPMSPTAYPLAPFSIPQPYADVDHRGAGTIRVSKGISGRALRALAVVITLHIVEMLAALLAREIYFHTLLVEPRLIYRGFSSCLCSCGADWVGIFYAMVAITVGIL